PRTRRWLFAHAPAEVAVEVVVPRGALFQTSLALDPAAWEGPLGDGVRFVVGVTPVGGAESSVLDATVHARGRGAPRRGRGVAGGGGGVDVPGRPRPPPGAGRAAPVAGRRRRPPAVGRPAGAPLPAH